MKNIFHHGFSMLELILVIIILGIVSSIGAEIIANVYNGYILQRAQHRASIKTELAAIQIANRLAYAIPNTVVRKSSLTDDGQDITEAPEDDHNILQWVGSDADSFKAITSNTDLLPGWSGFCDVNVSSTTSISTPGSNLSLVNSIRTNLGLTSTPQIYFPVESGLRSYQAALSAPTNTINLSNYIAPPIIGGVAKIAEHYKLATSSYALEARTNGDLVLHYNFAPQRDVNINGSAQILLRNVSTFEFRGDGRTLRFKICADEEIGADFNITICKEKAVF